MRFPTLAMRCLLLLVALGFAPAVRAQLPFSQGFSLDAASPAGAPLNGEALTVEAKLAVGGDGRSWQLRVTAHMADGWYTYSTTKTGSAIATQISVKSDARFELAGDFTADPPPELKTVPSFGTVQAHKKIVTWTAPLRFAAGIDPTRLEVAGKVYAQACNATSCLAPKSFPFVARADGSGAANPIVAASVPVVPERRPQGATEYRHRMSHTTIRGSISQPAVSPGGNILLELASEPDAGWHAYAWAGHDTTSDPGSKAIAKPTLITLGTPDDWRIVDIQPNTPPLEKASVGGVDRYHEGAVTWRVSVAVPAETAAGEYLVAGLIGYQTCSDAACDIPLAARFEGTVLVGAAGTDVAVGAGPIASLKFTDGRYRDAAAIAMVLRTAATPSAGPIGLRPVPLSNSSLAGRSMLVVLPLAFVAGLILNVMPCVLPVIGLKIMAFVHQAGEDRRRVFMLNLWYALGLMSVFLVLAALAVVAGLGWGEQFQNAPFKIVMTSIVFVFALSMLGVWEIPIPGFVGGGAASGLGEREGAVGAFAKGVLTTILATPCTGPFLGSALTWAVGQPKPVTFAAFASVGLGMASPYLLIGAFPNMIRFLPKPGAWMETFKQLMGFVLLGTVVFLLRTVTAELVVPTVALLMGLWFACWWVGRTSQAASVSRRFTSWVQGATIATLAVGIAFGWLAQPPKHELPWQPFSRPALEQFLAEGNTVLVDFTADW